MKKSLLLMAILTMWLGIYSVTRAANLTLQITPGPIHIDSSGSINIGAISTSWTTGEINTSFSSDAFRVGDLRWWPGYYTTIQFSNLINWWDSIANINIQLKTLATPNIINGNTTPFMRFGNGIQNIFSDVNQPMTYFVRKTNERTWSIGKFWDTPDIKISVPANQPSGTYRGTTYYTLYDIE